MLLLIEHFKLNDEIELQDKIGRDDGIIVIIDEVEVEISQLEETDEIIELKISLDELE
jgi:hypothetical protein